MITRERWKALEHHGMQLFNTLTGRLETFTDRDGSVGLYVCGVTPYDTTHIGHAFTFLTYDILTRYLRYKGLDVTYVQNVTDIDDDILRKAGEVGMNWRELADRETERYLQDMADLNALPFDHYVKATDHIDDMIGIIERLVEGGYAYPVNGSVYFQVAKDPDFGQLSKIPRDQMLDAANERGNVPDDPNKRDPLDFILWQATKEGEPAWDSPWGPGRPGWHIECSAMSTHFLGDTIDIHGGGGDLIFPHHEAEIAQTEKATGQTPFVRYWMHVAMVAYQGTKMSKSLGNLVLARELLETYSADTIRLCLFSHHYRTEWEYLDDEIEEWSRVAADLEEAFNFPADGPDEPLDVSTLRDQFFQALENDLDTPEAIRALQEMALSILEAPESDDVRDAQNELGRCAGILGLTLEG
ncbi:MAG TPA: cysteine--tRNA ligase [Thermomicrobiales bacterium]|nr:cysteine--tRNA ligase [Thermomicrobiales bacterium]